MFFSLSISTDDTDLFVGAATGNGKTLAFLIPIVVKVRQSFIHIHYLVFSCSYLVRLRDRVNLIILLLSSLPILKYFNFRHSMYAQS